VAYAWITEKGYIRAAYRYGEYIYSAVQLHTPAENTALPLISYEDITLKSDNTIEISDLYMKELYRAWVESDIKSAWYFNNKYINYIDLVHRMDSNAFSTTVKCNSDGSIASYTITFGANGINIYSLTFENTAEKATVDFYMNIFDKVTSKFEYIKGDFGHATFDLIFDDGTGETYDYHASVDVQINAPDFVLSDKLVEIYDRGIECLDDLAESPAKFEGNYALTGETIRCYNFVYYDPEFDAYVAFYKNYADGTYYAEESVLYMEFSKIYLDEFCIVSIDEDTKTLTITEHCRQERLGEEIGAKYSGIYTLDGAAGEDLAVGYDAEYGVCIVFELTAEGYQYIQFVNPAIVPSTYVIAEIDIENKVLIYK
jgi:hypothetical protein